MSQAKPTHLWIPFQLGRLTAPKGALGSVPGQPQPFVVQLASLDLKMERA